MRDFTTHDWNGSETLVFFVFAKAFVAIESEMVSDWPCSFSRPKTAEIKIPMCVQKGLSRTQNIMITITG